MPEPLFIAWLSVLSVVAVVWATRHVQISRASASKRALTAESHAGPPAPAPRVSVIVAAKDEQDNIESCVVSFLEQDYPNFELIVVDDRSTDRTPQILHTLAERYGDRLKVLRVERLRDGWFGKNNAMREGVAASDGDWLCFADADCRQTSPRSLSMAVAEAVNGRIDFLSVLPVLETKSFWERIIQPVCAAVMIFWYHPDKVNDPKRGEAYANGAFMLMKRDVYEALGGHEGVKTEVNEDMHLARLAKGQGHRLQVILNDGLYVTRMYASLGQIWHGWSRIFYGCLGSFRRIVAAILILTSFSILPWASLLASLTGWAIAPPASGGWSWIVLASLAAVALQQSVMVRFYRVSRSGMGWSATYIVGAVVCLGMLCNALSKLGGTTRIRWRGTDYRGKALDRPDGAGQTASEVVTPIVPGAAADEVSASAS